MINVISVSRTPSSVQRYENIIIRIEVAIGLAYPKFTLFVRDRYSLTVSLINSGRENAPNGYLASISTRAVKLLIDSAK